MDSEHVPKLSVLGPPTASNKSIIRSPEVRKPQKNKRYSMSILSGYKSQFGSMDKIPPLGGSSQASPCPSPPPNQQHPSSLVNKSALSHLRPKIASNLSANFKFATESKLTQSDDPGPYDNSLKHFRGLNSHAPTDSKLVASTGSLIPTSSNTSPASNSPSLIATERERLLPSPSLNLSSASVGGKGTEASFSFKNFQRKLSNAHIKHFSNLPNVKSGIKSVSSQKSLTKLLTGKIFSIQFVSNWGNPEFLMLSSVSLLDKEKKQIPLKTISSVPDLPNLNLLEKLADTNLVKKEDELFTIPFCPSRKETFSLIIETEENEKPKYVRVWNPQQTTSLPNTATAAVKEVIIFMNNKEVAKGEIPRGFGSDLEIFIDDETCSNSSLLLAELFPSLKPEEKVRDDFGIYPFLKFKEITFEILSNYFSKSAFDLKSGYNDHSNDGNENNDNNNHNHYYGNDYNGNENDDGTTNVEEIEFDEKNCSTLGLNGIDFFDDKCKKLINMDFDDITSKNVHCTISKSKFLVRGSMKTCAFDSQYFGRCQYSYWNHEKNPILIFRFREETRISKIRIWNFNDANKGLENGVRDIVIRGDGKLIWKGRIKKGSGLITGVEKSSTKVWLTDMTSLRHKVSKNEKEQFDQAHSDLD